MRVEEDEASVEMSRENRGQLGMGGRGRKTGITRAKPHRSEEKSTLHFRDPVEIEPLEEKTDEEVTRHPIVEAANDASDALFAQGLT